MAVLLVTGSRMFTDRALVRYGLMTAVEAHGPGLVVRHGWAPGAETLAEFAARGLGLETDPYRADWDGPCRSECQVGHRRMRRDGSTFCPAAGHYRNRAMADAGAVECLAFLVPVTLSPCKGTRGMMRLARAARIPVTEYTQAPR